MRTVDHPRDAVIVQAIRTPLCRARKGELANVPPSALLASVLRGVLLKEPNLSKATDAVKKEDYLIEPHSVQDICVGNVLSPPTAAVSFRMAALASGIPHTTSLSTTNRQCSSGLQAIANIAFAIQAGSINIGIGEKIEVVREKSQYWIHA
jgi:acetyl-CoA acyltransferase 1